MSMRKIFYRGSLITLLLSFGGLGGCQYKQDYFYFDFVDATVAEADWQKPEFSTHAYIGDKVPLKTSVDWNGEIVHFLNDPTKCCGPRVEIHSPFTLSDLIVTGTAYDNDGNRHDYETGPEYRLTCPLKDLSQVDENVFGLHWSYRSDSFMAEHGSGTCIRIGEEITIKLVPENGSVPLTVSATLVRSGFTWERDSL